MKALRFISFVLSLGIITALPAQQLCEGSLGENIFIAGDFGSGSATVLPNDPQIAPGYIYEIDPAPNDGFYTISNNTGNWSSLFQSWIRTGDNSTDPNGYMMVVNASFEPGLFYEEIVTDLCENTFYQFSADIINLVKTGTSDHTRPNVSFLINDIQQFTTGNIPQNETWQKYGFTFTTEPGETEVKLSLRNNAPGGFGNDLALDNIRFQACGTNAFLNANQTIFLCENDNEPVKLEADISEEDQAILWQVSTDSITWIDLPDFKEEFIFHEDYTIGTYYYRYATAGTEIELENRKCRVFSNVLTIEVLPLDYMVYDTICYDQIYSFGNLELDSSGNYFNAFTSSRGCDSLVDLHLTVLDKEAYQLNILLMDPNCFGSSDGSISGTIENAFMAPYSFMLNDKTTTELDFNQLSAGNYTLIVVDRNGCSQSFEYTLIDPKEFTISLPEDTLISLGETLDISLGFNQAIEIVNWRPPEYDICDTCLEFTYQPNNTHTLVAQAFNEKGCNDRDSMLVEINKEDLKIYIPNIVSNSLAPINNNFTIGATEGLISEVIHFTVYDRWGNLIYRITNTSDLELWKNPNYELGVYTYHLEVQLIDGSVYPFFGDFLLLR